MPIEPVLIKPRMNEQRAAKLLLDLYGLKAENVKAMCSYDDLNFHFTVEPNHTNPHLETLWPHGYTMKVVNSLDTGQEGLLESFHEAMFHLKSHGLDVPVPVPNLSGQYCQRMELEDKDQLANEVPEKFDKDSPVFAVFLLTFLPGSTLASVQYTPEVLKSVGQTLAQVTAAFQGCCLPVLDRRDPLWSLWSIPRLEKYTFALTDHKRKSMVENVIKKFTQKVLPVVRKHPQALIHGDLNEHNMLVASEPSRGPRVSGVLDLGDVHRAPRVFEVAVCLTYPMLGGVERLGQNLDPLWAPGHVLAGLADFIQLTSEEQDILKLCIEARLAQSLTMGAYTNHMSPGNDYVLDSSRNGWTVLQRLVESDDQELLRQWTSMAAPKPS